MRLLTRGNFFLVYLRLWCFKFVGGFFVKNILVLSFCPLGKWSGFRIVLVRFWLAQPQVNKLICTTILPRVLKKIIFVLFLNAWGKVSENNVSWNFNSTDQIHLRCQWPSWHKKIHQPDNLVVCLILWYFNCCWLILCAIPF